MASDDELLGLVNISFGLGIFRGEWWEPKEDFVEDVVMFVWSDPLPPPHAVSLKERWWPLQTLPLTEAVFPSDLDDCSESRLVLLSVSRRCTDILSNPFVSPASSRATWSSSSASPWNRNFSFVSKISASLSDRKEGILWRRLRERDLVASIREGGEIS